MDSFSAAPLVDDLWCDLCQEEAYTGITADGVKACNGCMVKVLDGIAEEAGATMVGPNRAQRRAMRKGMKRRGKGWTRGN